MSRTIAAVSFDAGNTLIESHPSPAVYYARALSRLGRPVAADRAAQAFATVWRRREQQQPPGADRYALVDGRAESWWRQLVQEVITLLDHDADPEAAFVRLWADFGRPETWRTRPAAVETLTRLRGMGLRLAVVSNWDHRLPEVLAATGLDHWLDVVVVSHLEGVEKPAPEIFRRAVRRLGVDPGRTLHVGDSYEHDYRGAASAGLVPVLYDPDDTADEGALRRVAHLAEIPALVRSVAVDLA